MTERLRKVITTVAVLAAVTAGSAVIANAASSGSSSQGSASSSGTTGSEGPQRGDETPLSGDTADKVRAAALAKVPNGTILRVETNSDGSRYEAHVRKADGSEVVVEVNAQFEVTGVQEFGGGRGPGDGDGGSGSGDSSGTSTPAPAAGGQV
jgi:uncharacterized membrane protein YkoI